jgi:hypothetical protein
VAKKRHRAQLARRGRAQLARRAPVRGDANPRAGVPWAGESGPDDEADSTSKLEAEAGSIDIDGPVATW